MPHKFGLQGCCGNFLPNDALLLLSAKDMIAELTVSNYAMWSRLSVQGPEMWVHEMRVIDSCRGNLKPGKGPRGLHLGR